MNMRPLAAGLLLTLQLTACGGGDSAPANAAPVAAFSVTPAGGIAPQTLQFDASASTDSDGSINSYAWAFGDGGTASVAAPAHLYASAGTYTVTLTVTDDDGDSHSSTRSISIAANNPPVAQFTATPTGGIAPETIQFNAAASSDSDGSIASYIWSFSDGGSASGVTASRRFATAGTHSATLTITDDKGTTATQTVNVTLAANAPPVAVLGLESAEGLAPFNVALDGRGSSDSDGTIASWVWSLPGANPAAAAVASPTVQYATPGEYTAQLTVTDNKGSTATSTRTIYVADKDTDSFTLAGAYTVPDTAFADCDTPGNGGTACNDATASAQAIQSPAVVAGHARVSASSDITDNFRVSFAGGETLTLAVASSNAGNDLDLQLWDAAGTALLAQASGPDTPLHVLPAPSAGDYLVRVVAISGASNYVLNVAAATARVADDGGSFMDGEFIVHFSELRIPWRIDAQREARAAEVGLAVLEGDADTPMLMRDTQRSRTLRKRLDAGMQRALEKLRRHPQVAWAELNRVRQPLVVDATDTYYPLQWNLPLARFNGAWGIDTQRGSGVIVAVIDTGILQNHPDLAGRLVDGYDFVSETANANDGNGIDNNPADPGGDGILRSTFHGTHVAGIVAANAQFTAAGGNSGIAGAAPAAKIMPVRAIGRYGGLSYDIARAIRYAAGVSASGDPQPAQRADIINLSIGSTGYSQAEQDAISAARAAGVIVVAAGGNSGDGTTFYPAGYAGVVGVGAVTLDRRRAAYSNTGAHIDVSAPGGDRNADLDGNGFPDGIVSTLANDSSGSLVFGYDFYQGTSMAAPHVAAVAALMKSLQPSLTPALFDSLLASGALTRDLGAGGRDDEFGSGLIDAEKALVATGMVSATPALATATPARLNLGALSAQALVVIDNAGGGTLTVNSVSDDASWLTVNTQAVDANGVGSYLVSVDRDALANGTHSASITFATSAGSINVPVRITKDASVQLNGVGPLWAIVWDPVTRTSVGGSLTPMSGISASFNLGSVPAGEYQIYIGTDNDMDDRICDAGEACGAWLSLQQPTLFTHARHRDNLSLSIGFSSTLTTLTSDGQPALPPQGFPKFR
jgi:serine protease